ncbi:MAG TPA: LacI family DNA-binding transcriptional regulator [Candidatus Sulfotelmatobacter sp.]|jgi:DNA-binding LacI/PurR family transcriptional regulator|nr:LacI family DNA-binding transcriptional regulator [Candidatus Sulfotelmatobacter sp.]
MSKHTRNIAKAIAPVTLRTVADYAGVTAGTVSAILNRAPQSAAIPQQTKDRVFAAALKLRYQPNPFARALRKGHHSLPGSEERTTAASRALLFDGEEHFRQAMNAIRQAGLRVPGDVSELGAGEAGAV